MPGSSAGGRKTAKKIKAKYGDNYYVELGRRGGAVGRTGGFASTSKGKDGLTGQERAILAGQAGGKRQKLENFVILDEVPFDDGFDLEPSAWDKLRSRLGVK